jgi:hypothetical protein
MTPLRRLLTPAIAVAAVISSSLGYAQIAGLDDKLTAQYTLTKATASRDDIVTAGSVLVLEKDGLLMYTTTTTVPPTNTYKDGKISTGVFGVGASKWLHKIPGTGSAPNPDNRTFVSGEKFWVTKIYQRDDGVYFELFSDPINNLRYYTLLKFPFPKGDKPTVDQMVSTIGQVLKVQPADDSGGDTKQAAAAPADKAAPAAPAAAAAPAAPAAAMAPIAPPPPPADAPPPQPKTVALGQTKDQVIAIFGQPTRIANLGTKEIDYYPDMKVTFVKGKVSDVQ